MRKVLAVSFLVILIAGCGGLLGKGGVQTIRLSLIIGESSDWYAGCQRFKELIEQRTDGRFQIKIDPKATLSNSNQESELENVQNGVLQASIESTILLSTLDQRFSAWSLPWLFKDHAHAASLMDGPLGKEMLDLLPAKQLVGLAYGTNGFRQLTNNRRPVVRVEDLAGLKVRIPAIKMYTDVFRTFGADPSVMNFGDLITALQQGTMDGQENPLSSFYPQRLFEVQKYLTIWDYLLRSDRPVLQPQVFRVPDAGRPDDLPAGGAGGDGIRARSGRRHDIEYLENLRQEGMEVTILGEAERLAFARKAAPVYEQYRDTIGSELLDRFLKAGSIGIVGSESTLKA
jgi:tripartite ATP-independent transporter DctP family solute receptor